MIEPEIVCRALHVIYMFHPFENANSIKTRAFGAEAGKK